MRLEKNGNSFPFSLGFHYLCKVFLPHKNHMDITILGIESSCDDTSAAVIRDRTLPVSYTHLTLPTNREV